MSFSALFISSGSVETATVARPVLLRFGSCKFMSIELFESEVSRTRTPTVNYKGKKYKDKALSTLGSRWHAPRANMKH